MEKISIEQCHATATASFQNENSYKMCKWISAILVRQALIPSRFTTCKQTTKKNNLFSTVKEMLLHIFKKIQKQKFLKMIPQNT
jgi:hypothetical protein